MHLQWISGAACYKEMPSQATADAKFADYAPKLAFFFPGQGAQTIGMAKV